MIFHKNVNSVERDLKHLTIVCLLKEKILLVCQPRVTRFQPGRALDKKKKSLFSRFFYFFFIYRNPAFMPILQKSLKLYFTVGIFLGWYWGQHVAITSNASYFCNQCLEEFNSISPGADKKAVAMHAVGKGLGVFLDLQSALTECFHKYILTQGWKPVMVLKMSCWWELGRTTTYLPEV